jgi:hypothetical protein
VNLRRTFRLTESLGALKFEAGAGRPSYVRLAPGTILYVDYKTPASGLIDVELDGATLTVFAEDLLARSQGRAAHADSGCL